MTKSLLTALLVIAPALALGGCGGGSSYGGDLYIDGSEIENTPSLSGLKGGLRGDRNDRQYSENPLLNTEE